MTPFLADFTQVIFFDAVTMAGLIFIVFAFVFAVGSLMFAGGK